jgi:hypothetical protein
VEKRVIRSFEHGRSSRRGRTPRCRWRCRRRQRAQGRSLRGGGDRVAERDASAVAWAKASAAVFEAVIFAHSASVPPAASASAASAARSTVPRFECRSSMPCASFVILATPPAMTAPARQDGGVRYLSMPPTKSPISISAVSGRAWSFCTAASELAPVEPAMGEAGGAGDTMPRWIEWDPGRAGIRHDDAGGAEDRQAADDAEPAVERLGGERCAAGDRDLDLDIAARLAPATSAMAVSIIWRGTGLMAGSPGGIASPARVTMPTPSPARKMTPLPGIPRRTVARMRAPWVTSGSSPASLTTPAVAESAPKRVTASAKLGRSPWGSVTSTGSGNAPVSSAA